MNTLECGTVRVFSSPSDALKDAEARPMKATWHNRGGLLYAVGDWHDLPAHVAGYWREITAADLAARAAQERKARRMEAACAACRDCGEFGFTCPDPVSQAVVDLVESDPDFLGPRPVRPDCYSPEGRE